MTQPASVLVTLCTYNERQNLEHLIPAIQKFLPEAEILVVDDNSPDGTGPYVAELAAQNSRIHLLSRPGKQGLGTATVAAFQWGIARQPDLLINLDADFSHPPRYLPALRDAVWNSEGQIDVAVASRYVPGGGVTNWGLHRHVMSRSINTYARLVLGLRTHDNSGSYRCYRVSRLQQVDWTGALARGYAIQEEILYRLHRAGATFVEVPFQFEERRFGETKITWKEAVAAGWVLLRLRCGG